MRTRSSIQRASLCLLLFVVSSRGHCQQFSAFLPPVSYGSGGDRPQAVAIADLNADGKQDLVVGNFDSVAILLGRGDGTFEPAKTYGTDEIVSSIAVADMNGDHVPDLITAQCGQSVVVPTAPPVVLWKCG